MLASLLPWLLVLPALAQAGTFDSPVINVGGAELKKILREDKLSVVTFYAPWCGHCKNLAPEAKLAARALSPLIPFYAIDCDEQANKPFCAEQGIKGFPTIKAFTRGSKLPPKDYNGDRKKGPLVGWATSLVNEKVTKLRVPAQGGVSGADGIKEVDKYLAKDNTKPHVLLVHPTAASIPLMWKVLSSQVPAISFGFIRDADGAVGESLGLGGDASKVRIALWEKGATSSKEMPAILYTGSTKFEALLMHFRDSSSVLDKPATSPSDNEKPGPPPPAGSSASSASPPPPNASAVKRAEERAKAEARWAEEERRDRERLAKLAAKKAAAKKALEEEEEEAAEVASGTKEAEAAAPEPAEVEQPVVVVDTKEETTAAAEPAPAAGVQDGEKGEKAVSPLPASQETGKESVLTEEQAKVVKVEQDSIGGQDEEIAAEPVMEESQVPVMQRDEL